MDFEKRYEEDLSTLYSQMVYRKAINFIEDLEFIIKIVNAKTNKLNMSIFIHFIDESDSPIEGLKNLILGLCRNIIKKSKESNDIYGIAPELSRLIASLYNKTHDNFAP